MKTKISQIFTALTELESKGCHAVFFECGNGKLRVRIFEGEAIAVFGDTKAVKDELKALGGRFNPKLSHEGGKRAGWIFQKSKEQEVRALLAINLAYTS